MPKLTDDEIAEVLIFMLTDNFNRSLGALVDAGALDTRKMNAHYTGVGSKYYDIVTEQIYRTARLAAPRLRQIIQGAGEHPDAS